MTERLATWHITFGTYGTRLHGDGRPTVERERNRRGEAFIYDDADRVEQERDCMRGEPVYLALSQRAVIEGIMPLVCERGGWVCHICAAPREGDHVHVLLDAERSVDPGAIMRWMKRWLGEELTRRWGRPGGGTWWAKGGSTKPVQDESYLNNVYAYIRRQRTLMQAE